MKSSGILPVFVILMALVVTASAATVPASPSTTPKPPEEKKYFRCLAWNQDISGLYVTQSDLPVPGAKTPSPTPTPTPTPTPKPSHSSTTSTPVPDTKYKEEQLMIPGAVRSRVYAYLPSKPLKIIRHVGNKITVISTLDMHSAPALALLFFIPTSDVNSMDIRVIDDGIDTFPGGGVELFNYSHISPTFVFETTSGKQSVELDPGSSKIVPLTFDPNTTARFSVLVPDKTTPTFSTALDMFSSIRYTAFVVDDPNDKTNVHYSRIPDNITNLKLDLDRLKKADVVPVKKPDGSKKTDDGSKKTAAKSQ